MIGRVHYLIGMGMLIVGGDKFFTAFEVCNLLMNGVYLPYTFRSLSILTFYGLACFSAVIFFI